MRVRVNQRNQITLPEEVRRRLRIQPGDELVAEARGDTLVLSLVAGDIVEQARGLHKEIWAGIDAQEYVRREREARPG